LATGWTVRRTGARRPVVLALAALIAVTSFLLAGIAGFGTRVGTVGLRDYLRAADGTDVSLQAQTRLVSDAAGQRRAADALFGRLFAGLHVDTFRSVTLPPAPVTATSRSPQDAPDGAPTIRLAFFDGLAEHAHVLSGAWPDTNAPPPAGQPQPVALQQSAAQALDLTVGDTLSIGNSDRTTFTVAAIWAPDRSGDPFFTADAAAAKGADALAADRAAAGFLIAPEAVIVARAASGNSAVLANWTIAPDADSIVPSEITALAAAVDQVPAAFGREPGLAPQGSLTAGRLSSTLRTVNQSVTAAQAVGPVPSLLVGAISLLMLIQLARLLAVERRSETALIRSRGASAGQLTRIAVVEAAAISLPAATVGAGVAAGVLALTDAVVPASGWAMVAAVAAVGVVVTTTPAVHQARLPANRQQIDDSGRVRALTATGTVLLVLIAAGVSLWRFLRTGSALVVGADGSTRIDPIAVLAPALVLIAAAVLAGVLFGLAAGGVEALAARGRGLGTALASRQVARRGTVFGVIVLLVAIALGSVAVAATYSPTQAVDQQQTDVLRNGAPLLVQLPGVDPVAPQQYRDPVGAVAGLGPVGDAVTAVQLPVTVGGTAVSLTGVDAGRLASVVPSAPGAFEPDRLAPVLRTEPAGWPLPDGTTAVTLSLGIAAAWYPPGTVTSHSDGPPTQAPGGPGPEGLTSSVDLSIWVQAPDGALARVPAGSVTGIPVAPLPPGTPTDADVTATLSGLQPGSRLVALDLATPSANDPMAVDLAVHSVTATTGSGDRPIDIAAGTWAPQPQPQATNEFISQLLRYTLAPARSGVGLSGPMPAGQVGTARLTPTGPATLPVAIDRRLADQLGLQLGDSVTVALDAARQFPATVAAISPLLPGDVDAPRVLADMSSLQRMLLRSTPDLPAANQLWIRPNPDATDAAAAAIRPLVPATATIVGANSRSAQALLAPTALTLWFGAAGALLLAAIGVASVIATLSRSRRGELVVLRSVGITAREQARSRRRELLATVASGWLLGVLVGGAAVLTTVAGLAGSAIVGSLGVTPTLHTQWAVAGILIGVHVVIVIAVVAVHSARLRRQVVRSTPSELVL
jgi:ABC-type lipoprotein release transport system permease subunit